MCKREREMCKRDYARIAFLLFCCTAKTAKTAKYAQRGMSRTGLRLATATPTLAALRPAHAAHDHARAEHARHARCTRASLVSDARALTLQHAHAMMACSCH
tara:strand:+ start:507 stop:812 length:306 start_codon:yes stop_codon:yes gene_type:complete